ncbi:amidohydrolase [Bacillus sp. PK3_68]|uniref:amidohydrolase n=1 Tax=Bacillus sp. PK3_68 TaxID=2027408 RepID=UPI000E76A688|nr:amidohydrolase [Bacillus sp. PK3_68]RJS50113.1 deaminase [Bacillus sp. PK3_68]
MNKAYWIQNVCLQEGYEYEGDRAIGTKSASYHLFIEEGKIAKIISADILLESSLPIYNANHLLALPSFVEKHCHLDKTFLGETWRACTPSENIVERLAIEKKMLANMSLTTEERAENMLQRLLDGGATHIRTHVDVDPEVGLKNLESVLNALNSYSDKLSYEIVAFPQQGLLRSNSTAIMREALKFGANLVGGVDPGGIDRDIEASLYSMVELAVESNSDIDLHLHDSDHLGAFTIKRLISLTQEAGWQGRVAISHAYCLGEISKEETNEIADMLAEAGITIITSVPIDSKMPPVDLLLTKGVNVAAGSDNIYDAWAPFGNGDILERASRMAERFGWIDEKSLAQTLHVITGGKAVLNKQEQRVWPLEGEDANLVLVEASCSAETVARRAKRHAVIYKGKIVSGSI